MKEQVYLIISNCSNSYNSKKEIFQNNFKNYKEKNFLFDLKQIDWHTLSSDCKQDVNLSYKNNKTTQHTCSC